MICILHNSIIFLLVFLSHPVRFIWPIQRLCTSIIVDGNGTRDFQPLVSVAVVVFKRLNTDYHIISCLVVFGHTLR